MRSWAEFCTAYIKINTYNTTYNPPQLVTEKKLVHSRHVVLLIDLIISLLVRVINPFHLQPYIDALQKHHSGHPGSMPGNIGIFMSFMSIHRPIYGFP